MLLPGTTGCGTCPLTLWLDVDCGDSHRYYSDSRPRNLQYLLGARLPNDQLLVRFFVRCRKQSRREYPHRNSETYGSPVVSFCEVG